MSALDGVVMFAMVMAVVAVVLVAILVLVYAWALRRRRELDETEASEVPAEYPPDGRFEL
jgi:heme/copper-type cytochrome/quinol oxidase subunit 2